MSLNLSLARSPAPHRGGGSSSSSSAALEVFSPGSMAFLTAKGSTRLNCSWNIGGKCRHALATRECFDCKRWDVTGTGYYCEPCFAARHPWTRAAHNFVLLRQRPPTPPKRAPLNAVAERTVSEATALLNSTLAAGEALGAPAARAAPALSSAASKCDELLGRMTGMILQLRDGRWQARQLAARRIQLCWRGIARRRWWRVATALLWGRLPDAASGDFFFVNMASMKTQWEVPAVFGAAVAPLSIRRVWPCMLSDQAAAAVIQRAARGLTKRMGLARDHVNKWRRVGIDAAQPLRSVPPRRRARRPHEPEQPPHYYYNVVSGEARIEKPRYLFVLEPEVYGTHKDDLARNRLASLLQAVCRKFRSRLAFFRVVGAQYHKVWDHQYRRFYVRGAAPRHPPPPRPTPRHMSLPPTLTPPPPKHTCTRPARRSTLTSKRGRRRGKSPWPSCCAATTSPNGMATSLALTGASRRERKRGACF
jgi:hypothetical protein